MDRLRALKTLAATRLTSLVAAARVMADARVLAGFGGAAILALAALLALANPADAYAVARVEIPLVETDIADAAHAGARPGGDRRDVEGPADAGADAPAPRPAPVYEPLIELRPAVDRAVEPRLAGVEDLGASGAHLGGAPQHAEAGGGAGLPPAPIMSLTRAGPGGLLPRIAPDGSRPADAYARPSARAAGEPAIAIVIGGLGLNAAATRQAIEELPPEITLSFVPYAEGLQDWIDAARAAGHETMLELPMEPYDYPANDPGPHTLLAGADPDENRRRLEWLMSRATGYFGVMNYMGARFTAQPEALSPVFAMIAETGVAFLYDGESRRSDLEAQAVRADLDAAVADRILDEHPTAAAVDENLLELEAFAIQNGDAIGAGFGYPVTIRQVGAWARSLELKGYVLAPVSAVLAARADDAEIRVAEAADVAPISRASYRRMGASFGGGGEDGADADAGGEH